MNLLILGAGEYGKLVYELAQEKYDKIDFLDDNSPIAIGKLSDYEKYKDSYQNAIVAIGNSEVRLTWLSILSSIGYHIPSIISSKAYVSPSTVIEEGTIIEPMVAIHTGAKIEKGSIISAGAVINHNSIVKLGCHIDCNAVVGADAVVPESTHLAYGQVITKEVKPENWSFSE